MELHAWLLVQAPQAMRDQQQAPVLSDALHFYYCLGPELSIPLWPVIQRSELECLPCNLIVCKLPMLACSWHIATGVELICPIHRILKQQVVWDCSLILWSLSSSCARVPS
jgi:hypothetical protein